MAFRYHEPKIKINRESVFEENAKKYSALPAPNKYQHVLDWKQQDKTYRGKFSKYKNVNMFESLISQEKKKPGPTKYINNNWDTYSYRIPKCAAVKDERTGVFDDIKFHES